MKKLQRNLYKSPLDKLAAGQESSMGLGTAQKQQQRAQWAVAHDVRDDAFLRVGVIKQTGSNHTDEQQHSSSPRSSQRLTRMRGSKCGDDDGFRVFV
jgi:hypothetical protein